MNVDLYRKLFVHRADVFAEQHESGAYTPVRRPLNDEDIADHLAGLRSYGVYVIDPEPSGATWEPSGWPMHGANTVKCAVFDLDTYDKAALVFLCDAVERLVAPLAFAWDRTNTHRQSLMLEDSGGKGYHIWLFFDGPVGASRVRAWTEQVRAAYVAEANRLAYDVTAWPALEIFPKQDRVPEGGFGNLVKLPFGVHQRSKARSFIQQRAGWAGSLEDVRPFPASVIPESAATSERPPRSAQRGEAGGSPVRFACIARIIEDGAPQGTRDVAMLHLAHYARGCGLPEWLTEQWCQHVNGEAFDPPLKTREVVTKVASAYRMAAPHPSCSQDWLRDFCPGSDCVRSCPNFSEPEAPQRDGYTFGDE